jgi:hypothetical protein
VNRREPDPDQIPVKICVECTQPFEAIYKVCPYCAAPYTPQRRDGPEFVDGDLVELDAATLAELYGEIERVEEDPNAVRTRMIRAGAPRIAAEGAYSQQRRRRDAQQCVKRLIEVFAGIQVARGRDYSEAYRRFFFRYGVDVMSAQALSRPESMELALRLIEDMRKGRV